MRNGSDVDMIRVIYIIAATAFVVVGLAASIWLSGWHGDRSCFGVFLLICLSLLLVHVSIHTVLRNQDYGEFCHKRRYNLTGNESGVCPECGTKIESP